MGWKGHPGTQGLMCWIYHGKNCSPFTLNASLRLICTFDMYIWGWKPQQQHGERFVRAPTASLTACLAESRWNKRKAAVHGPEQWQSQKPHTENQLQKGLSSVDKGSGYTPLLRSRVTDEVLLESRWLLPEKSSFSCPETGFLPGVASADLSQPCLHHILSQSPGCHHSSHLKSSSMCHALSSYRNFVHARPILPHLFAKLAHTLPLSYLNSTISSLRLLLFPSLYQVFKKCIHIIISHHVTFFISVIIWCKSFWKQTTFFKLLFFLYGLMQCLAQIRCSVYSCWGLYVYL